MSVIEPAADNIEQACGLPASAYTSEEFMRHEQQTLFASTWHAVGFVQDVPNPGDICPVHSAAGRSLLLVHDQDSQIKVFHNFCRHRGMRLANTPLQGRKNIVCPYHAWCYDLDGGLLRIPHRDGYGKHGEAPGDIPGLVSVRSQVWAGIIFVDLSNQAGAFADYIAPLANRWASYDLSLLRPGIDMTFDVSGNWKLAIENFIDIYHVPFVHPGLNKYNAMTDHYFIDDGIVLGEGNSEYLPTDEGAHRLPEFPGLTQTERQTIEAVCLFPNLLLTIFSDNLRVILVEPTGTATCRERVSISFVGDEALSSELERFRTIVADRFPSFNAEDVAVVTQLQEAFETSPLDRFHFNRFFDGNVHRFQQLVASACG